MIEREDGNPGAARSHVANTIPRPLDVHPHHHYRLPLFSAEPQAFGPNFPCHAADICSIPVSPTAARRGAKQKTR